MKTSTTSMKIGGACLALFLVVPGCGDDGNEPADNATTGEATTSTTGTPGTGPTTQGPMTSGPASSTGDQTSTTGEDPASTSSDESSTGSDESSTTSSQPEMSRVRLMYAGMAIAGKGMPSGVDVFFSDDESPVHTDIPYGESSLAFDAAPGEQSLKVGFAGAPASEAFAEMTIDVAEGTDYTAVFYGITSMKSPIPASLVAFEDDDADIEPSDVRITVSNSFHVPLPLEVSVVDGDGMAELAGTLNVSDSLTLPDTPAGSIRLGYGTGGGEIQDTFTIAADDAGGELLYAHFAYSIILDDPVLLVQHPDGSVDAVAAD